MLKGTKFIQVDTFWTPEPEMGTRQVMLLELQKGGSSRALELAAAMLNE